MIIVASSNGRVGIDAGWDILAEGGSALDAVEAATRLVEDNPDDHTVGYGGYPNLLGDVELDASIMDGTSLQAGAVGALKGIRAPISIARRVMEELPHVLLVGEGAARFAKEMGFSTERMLSPEAEEAWREGIAGRLPAEFRDAQGAVVTELLSRAARLATDPERVAGTVNFIAQDAAGNIASAVSTSGWAWKYPGRLGDSPIIGAGNYADTRYGAAACTGWGELALRAASARSVVLYLKMGMSLAEATHEAFQDFAALQADPAKLIMNMVAIDRSGGHVALTTVPGRTYVYRTDGMTAAVEAARTVVQIAPS